MAVYVNGVRAGGSGGADGSPDTVSDAQTFTAALAVAVNDATANGVTDLATLTHSTSGTAAAGIGGGVLFRSEDASGNAEDVARINALLTVATGGAEASALDVYTRTGGAALAVRARVFGTGGLALGQGASPVDPGSGGISLSTVNGLYVNSAGVLYTMAGVFGGSAMTFGSGSFNVTIAAFALAISAGQGTTIASGWLSVNGGFGTKRTTVADAGYVATVNDHKICYTSITAARVVTGPSTASITRSIEFVIKDESGSASGANTITFTPASGTIDGAASKVVVNTARGSARVYFDGSSNWHTSV